MKYEPVIGLEIHAELATETKMFCSCPTTFGAEPNTHTCPVCIGMPGVLPVVNEKAFELGLKAALALKCRISRETHFDRKNYYYPDLPKNYQISQSYRNLGEDGEFSFWVNGEHKSVRIHNVHLEEDAGKNIHPDDVDANYSLVDLNRAGVPLLEIVTQPDFRSAEEVEAFMEALRRTLLYLEVSDCKMQEGSLRFEASISLRPKGSEEYGARVEIKNLNSMRSVGRAVRYEIERQARVLDRGEKVDRETRLWDDNAGKSARMRSKEEAHDYRYFPEPDLVGFVIDEAWIERVKASIVELPEDRRGRFVQEYGLSDYDAALLTSDRALADYFEQCPATKRIPKAVANWVTNQVLREINERGVSVEDFPVRPKDLSALVELFDQGKVNNRMAAEIFEEMLKTGRDPNTILEEKGGAQIDDADALGSILDEVIRKNPKAVEDWKAGKRKAIGFLVGQVMAATKGKANPKRVTEILQKKLSAL